MFGHIKGGIIPHNNHRTDCVSFVDIFIFPFKKFFIMEDQPKSKSKTHVVCFAVGIIVACIFSAVGIAMNTGKEKVDGYITCDDVVYRSLENANKAAQQQYILFQQMVADDDLLSKAEQLQNLSNELVCQIGQLRTDVINFSEGKDVSGHAVFAVNGIANVPHIAAKDITFKSDFDKSTYFLTVQQVNGATRAETLKAAIDTYKTAVLQLVPAAQRSYLASDIAFFNTNDVTTDGETVSWETHHFDHTILVATASTLDAFACDVRNIESIVLRYLITQ